MWPTQSWRSSALDNRSQGPQTLASGPYHHVLWLRVPLWVTTPQSLLPHKALKRSHKYSTRSVYTPDCSIFQVLGGAASCHQSQHCLWDCSASEVAIAVFAQNTFVHLTQVCSLQGLPPPGQCPCCHFLGGLYCLLQPLAS